MNKYTIVAVLLILSATIESISAIKWAPASFNVTYNLDTGVQPVPLQAMLSKSLKGDPDFTWTLALSSCKYIRFIRIFCD